MAVTLIPYTLGPWPVESLLGGFATEHFNFGWKPYEKRSEPQKADYDKLLVSIFHRGIMDPLIGWRRGTTHKRLYIIIGMRRLEIARRFGFKTLEVAEIQEDIQKWRAPDYTRLDRLRRELGQKEY